MNTTSVIHRVVQAFAILFLCVARSRARHTRMKDMTISPATGVGGARQSLDHFAGSGKTSRPDDDGPAPAATWNGTSWPTRPWKSPGERRAFATSLVAGRISDVHVQPGGHGRKRPASGRGRKPEIETLQLELLKAATEFTLASRCWNSAAGWRRAAAFPSAA